MAEPTLLEEQRENWGTRAGFVLAAIGSAVGLGNLWGFPYKLYSYGGGAFLIPYVIAMVLIGIPLLIAEFSLGHLTQRATPDAFGRANGKFAFVGWWQIILSFIIITYYAVILAYCLSFFIYSMQGIFTGKLPWAGEGIEGVKKAKSFFFEEYLGFKSGFALGRLRAHIIGALVVTWVAMYLCIFRGVKLVGKVVLWTVPLPWLMLLILTIRGLTLEGSIQGLEYYLEPNWSRLADPTTWRWAFGQMFFSMSLAFGVMITYSSFLHRKSDLNNNAVVIGLADLGTSFVAGLAVFATLGGMAFVTQMAGKAIPVEAVADSGPSLAFIAFPYALAQLPHAAWFSLLFFASLLLLGIDSAFSITESVLASVVDKTGWNRGKTLIGLTIVGLGVGLIFCTQGGLNWVGTLDDFINGTWGITLTALLEALVLGWLFRISRLRDHANERSDWKIGRWWDVSIRVVIPIVMAGLFAWNLFDALKDPGGYVFTYKADEQALTMRVPQELPARPLLEVQFVADFSGQAEHSLTLDETDAKSLKAWEVQAPAETQAAGRPGWMPLAPEGFAAEGLRGKVIRFTSAGARPATAYTIRCRWTSRPEKDPKTGLPVAVPEDRQPQWTQLAALKTNSTRAGLSTGNFAGLCVMALAPILAIAIAAKRFAKSARGDSLHLPYSDFKPRGRAGGALSMLLGLAAVAAAAAAFAQMLAAEQQLRAGADRAEAMGTIGNLPAPLAMIVAGTVAAGISLLLGGTLVGRCERKKIRASTVPRIGAATGVLGLGLCAGLALTYVTATMRFPVQPIEYDNELSATSYLILGCMLGLIVVGLGWCFYRAMKAAGGAAEEQSPEGVSQQ